MKAMLLFIFLYVVINIIMSGLLGITQPLAYSSVYFILGGMYHSMRQKN